MPKMQSAWRPGLHGPAKALHEAQREGPHMASVAAVVVAAGQGIRAGGVVLKQFRHIGGQTMLRRTLGGLLAEPRIGPIQPVIRMDDRALFEEAATGLTLRPPVPGGATRQGS